MLVLGTRLLLARVLVHLTEGVDDDAIDGHDAASTLGVPAAVTSVFEYTCLASVDAFEGKMRHLFELFFSLSVGFSTASGGISNVDGGGSLRFSSWKVK